MNDNPGIKPWNPETKQFDEAMPVDDWIKKMKGGLVGQNTALLENLRNCKFQNDQLIEQYNNARKIALGYENDIRELVKVIRLLLDDKINEHEWNQNKVKAEELIEKLGVEQ